MLNVGFWNQLKGESTREMESVGYCMWDIVCRNAMISGMAMNGDGEHALKLFSEMEKAKKKPDDITFLAIFISF